MVRVIAGTAALFAVGIVENPPLSDFDVLKYAVTQGGLVIVVLVLLWSYRKDLKALSERQDERLKVLTDMVQSNAIAMARMAAASEAQEKSAHRLARAVERIEERQH